MHILQRGLRYLSWQLVVNGRHISPVFSTHTHTHIPSHTYPCVSPMLEPGGQRCLARCLCLRTCSWRLLLHAYLRSQVLLLCTGQVLDAGAGALGWSMRVVCQGLLQVRAVLPVRQVKGVPHELTQAKLRSAMCRGMHSWLDCVRMLLGCCKDGFPVAIWGGVTAKEFPT